MILTLRAGNPRRVFCRIGDRPTGPLHLGHYVGLLQTRLQLQETHRQFVLVADTQALTDNAHDVDKVRRNVLEVVPVDDRDGQFTFERVVH
ncbi:tryptophanyl-tRNA synthetase [Ralstonia sp. 151470066-2]|jgi:tryptophanyl-tRNA synthetase